MLQKPTDVFFSRAVAAAEENKKKNRSQAFASRAHIVTSQ